MLAEFGYGAVPGPFVPSAIASALIAAHDPDAKVLAELASGEAIAAYAIDSGLTATRQGPDETTWSSVARSAPCPPRRRPRCWCCRWRSPAVEEPWVVLDADQLEIEPVKSVDPLRPMAHVRADAVEVGDDPVLSSLSMTTAWR